MHSNTSCIYISNFPEERIWDSDNKREVIKYCEKIEGASRSSVLRRNRSFLIDTIGPSELCPETHILVNFSMVNLRVSVAYGTGWFFQRCRDLIVFFGWKINYFFLIFGEEKNSPKPKAVEFFFVFRTW